MSRIAAFTSLGMPAHRVSTAQLQAAYPFVTEAGPTTQGTYIGRQLLGGAFCYDPWTLYEQGVLTNPNALVAGQVGRGKSAFLKSYLYRQFVFGRHAGSSTPKGSTARSPVRVMAPSCVSPPAGRSR